ncbi:MAG: hypothetical protein A2W22_03460 [Candidatus Levybacteria bacterium RBG_16_35_11]|nr:MAG: hypothetical protein A2W22_03460 [Candidatus Levybacteria bacterium RBG_16_35_11]
MKKILAIFAFFLILRLLPYVNSPIPLGYDAGIYLYEFRLFPSLPLWDLAGFQPGLFAVVYPFTKIFNPESLLIPFSIISQIVLFFSVYFVSRKTFGEKIALINTSLFTVSLVQFRTYWFFYVKNTFALAILLPALYFLQKKNFLWSVIFAVALAYFHLPTFLIFLLILIILFFFDRKNLIFYLKVLIATLVFFFIYYLPTFNTTILPLLILVLKSIAPYRLITTGSLGTGGGTFYSIPISFLMTIFYLLFAIIGAYFLKKEQKARSFLIALVLLFLMIITNFAFSRRYFIPFDLFLIFFAGYGINYVFEKYKSYKDILPFYYIVLIIFIFAFVFRTSQPLISASNLNEIRNFEKEGYVLSTYKEDTAWLLGYTKLKVIAWNFGGENKYWTDSQWRSFFSNDPVSLKLKLLNKIPKPLYIYISDKTKPILSDVIYSHCLKKETPHFYQNICKGK